MYQIDFKHPGKIHFIGIGGISMSGFAKLLQTMGFTISGSDANQSKITKHLETIDIHVLYGHDAENITNDLSLVVYTAAIHPENPELKRAKELGIPILERSAMVGQVMKNYSSAIAVAGTHGKTTTTSIISHVFLAAKKDPTITVGGILNAIGGNLRIGSPDYFIMEACEYSNSFLEFYPTVAVILNIEEDHLDFFKDLADIRRSFRAFCERVPAHGCVIINSDIENYEEIVAGLPCRVLTFGLESQNADFSAANIEFDHNGGTDFNLVEKGEIKGSYHLMVNGMHNVSNTLSAIALASLYDITPEEINLGLSDFYGTGRRFEYKGEVNGITVIDDYAHHPTEINATMNSAALYPHKNLWVLFQPHTYTRTRSFLKEFAKSLSSADKIILADIYAAREKDPGDISSLDLKNELEKLGVEVYTPGDFEAIKKFIFKNLMNGDLLITMGAGNIVDIGESLLGQ